MLRSSLLSDGMSAAFPMQTPPSANCNADFAIMYFCCLYFVCVIKEKSSMEIASPISIAQISMVGGAAGIWPSGFGVAGSRHARSTV